MKAAWTAVVLLCMATFVASSPARAQDSDSLTWARANSCERIRDYIARYPSGRHLTQARAQLTARNCPAPQATAPADPCVQARADWAAIATSSDVNVLRAFRTALPVACTVQRALADARIAGVQSSAAPRSPQRPTTPAATAQPRPAAPSPPIPLPEMVRIPGENFEVGRFEVTRAQWAAFVQATNRPDPQVTGNTFCTWRSPGFSQTDTHPVTCVNWEDAQDYVQWLSRRTGQRYRLLTSAEWEIAARAGTTTNYSWGDQNPVCDSNARNGANFFAACTDNRTWPVGSFPPNAFGLFDMHGNVWERVEDCYDSTCSLRVFRGGSWGDVPQNLRTVSRNFNSHTLRSNEGGFRVARTV